MELEEMKNTWEKMSKKIEKQEILTIQLIEKMTEQRYKSKLNKIVFSEYAATPVCFIATVLLVWNFNRLEQLMMQIFAALSIAYLVLVPIISLTMIKRLKRVNILSMTYSEAVQDYIRERIRFQKFQKLNVPGGFVFMAVSFPVLLKMMGKNVTDLSSFFWAIICPSMIALYFVFSRWVLKHYNKVLKEAEKELSELNN